MENLIKWIILLVMFVFLAVDSAPRSSSRRSSSRRSSFRRRLSGIFSGRRRSMVSPRRQAYKPNPAANPPSYSNSNSHGNPPSYSNSNSHVNPPSYNNAVNNIPAAGVKPPSYNNAMNHGPVNGMKPPSYNNGMNNGGVNGMKPPSYNNGMNNNHNNVIPNAPIGDFGKKPKSSMFGPTFGKSGKYAALGMASSKGYKSKGLFNSGIKKSNLVKGAVAAGAAYIGYKTAKGLGKAFFSSMRPSYYAPSYFDGPNYRYLGQVNTGCAIYFSITLNDQMMNCDQGRSFDYDRDMRYMNTRYQTQPYNADTAMKITGVIFGLFILFGCCFCMCGMYAIYQCSKAAQGATPGMEM